MDRQQLFGALWAIVTADPLGGLIRQLRREGVTEDELRHALVGLRDDIPPTADPRLAERFERAIVQLAERFRSDPAPRTYEPARAFAETSSRKRKAR